MLANKNIITKKKSLEKFEDKVEKILQTAEKQKWKERSRRRETKSGPFKVQYWWIGVEERSWRKSWGRKPKEKYKKILSAERNEWPA